MRTKRKGIAIVAALGGLVVIGALIAGVFFVSTQESEISGGALVHERAFRAAELGLNTTLANWDGSAMSALADGGIAVRAYAGPDWVDTVLITKLGQRSFSILSQATAGSGRLARSRKQTLLSVRLTVPTFNFLGALTVRGDTKIGGSSFVTGVNANPDGWGNCPGATGSTAGLAVATTNDVTTAGCKDWSCLEGSPKLLSDPAAADTSNYFQFGDMDWASLTAMATKVYEGSQTVNSIAPVVVGGVCNTSVKSNWGAPVHTLPANACENYFPIIHAKGAGTTLHLNGGQGQGIRLVDGDLEMNGQFEFNGPVIVRGRLKTNGGALINGAVMAANVDLDENVVLGNATVQYSSCAVAKAIGGSASPQRVVQRAWTEVH